MPLFPSENLPISTFSLFIYSNHVPQMSVLGPLYLPLYFLSQWDNILTWLFVTLLCLWHSTHYFLFSLMFQLVSLHVWQITEFPPLASCSCLSQIWNMLNYIDWSPSPWRYLSNCSSLHFLQASSTARPSIPQDTRKACIKPLNWKWTSPGCPNIWVTGCL